MSVTVDNLTFDFDTKLIEVQAIRGATLTAQDLINAIRQAEVTDEGMGYDKIADASGKDSLGGSTSVGITVNLLDWQIKWYAGTYQAAISGGNVVGGVGGNVIDYTAGVQVLLTQSANSTLIESGTSGLTPEESAALTDVQAKAEAVWEANFRRRRRVNNVIYIYEADGTTPKHTFNTNEDLTDIDPA